MTDRIKQELFVRRANACYYCRNYQENMAILFFRSYLCLSLIKHKMYVFDRSVKYYRIIIFCVRYNKIAAKGAIDT